jgi:hypothetical protein
MSTFVIDLEGVRWERVDLAQAYQLVPCRIPARDVGVGDILVDDEWRGMFGRACTEATVRVESYGERRDFKLGRTAGLSVGFEQELVWLIAVRPSPHSRQLVTPVPPQGYIDDPGGTPAMPDLGARLVKIARGGSDDWNHLLHEIVKDYIDDTAVALYMTNILGGMGADTLRSVVAHLLVDIVHSLGDATLAEVGYEMVADAMEIDS